MKKTICIFISLIIVISYLMPCAAINQINSLNDEIEFDTMVSVLNALSILPYSYDEIKSNKNVTRAELCSAMVGFMNLKEFSVDEKYFDDVTSSTKYVNEINILASLNYISGYDNKFNPSNQADVAAAMKILLNILDYSLIAQQNGYPDGYIAYGTKLGILKNISKYDVLTRHDLVKILYNALFVRIPEMSYSTGGQTYTIDSKNIAINKFFKVTAYEGRMSANTITTLTTAKDVKSNFVKIGTNVYKIESDVYDDYLGYNVEFYVKDGTDEIVFITGIGGESVNEINLNDIIEYEKSSKRLLYVDSNGKEKYIKIDPNADYIVNSTAYPQLDLNKLNKNFGTLKLVDADLDGKYETIFYDFYYNFVFESYSDYTDVVTGKNGEIIDFSEKYYSICDLNGEKVELSQLKNMDVLSVYEDMAEKRYKIILSNNIAAGKIEDSYTENDITNVYVGKVWYKADKNKILNLSNKQFKVGDQYILYLDYQGYVAYVDAVTVSDMLYGYLTAMTFEKEFGNESNLRLMTQYGNLVEYQLNNKVLFNGKYSDDSGKKYDAKSICTSSVFYKDGNFVPQLIKYQLNADGKIVKLETCDANIYDENSLKSGVTLTGSDSTWFKNQQSFFFKYVLDDDAVIFKVPKSESGVIDTKRMEVVTKESLAASKKYEGVTLYDIDKTNIAKVAVISDDAYNVVGYNVFVVEKVTRASNVNKDETFKIEGCYLNEKTSFYVSDADPEIVKRASGLTIGDIIAISLNGENEINNISVLAKSNDASAYENSSSGRGSTNYQTLGIITEKDGNVVKAILNKMGEDVYLLNSSVNVYLVNLKDKAVSTGEIADITPQNPSSQNVEYAFFKLYNDSVYDVVIIKNN